MEIVFRIKRYDRQNRPVPEFQDFEVSVEPTDRLLDALMFIKRNLDPTLSFRKSCAHGICGSDAMTINGVERLACRTLIRDVADGHDAVVTIEPLSLLPVQRDLMVDYKRFFETYRLVKPFLIPVKEIDRGENIQSPDELKWFADPTKCILCASCYSACPVISEKDPAFIGPAAVAQAARFIFDSRDKGLEARLEVLDDEHSVQPCENHFKCTQVCPRGIKVTKNINLVKRAIKDFKERSGEDT